jgi:hypothetical protein
MIRDDARFERRIEVVHAGRGGPVIRRGVHTVVTGKSVEVALQLK